MMTIVCDECGRQTPPSRVVFERVRHYVDPARWVALIQMCTACAFERGWRRTDDPNPRFSTSEQFTRWLQLTSR